MRIRQLIREALHSFQKQKTNQYKIREQNDSRVVELMNQPLLESDSIDVIQDIKNDNWEQEDPTVFHASLNKSRHGAMLTPYSVSELSKMKLFKLSGYDIGFALKELNDEFQEIVGVFNNEPEVKGIGKELVKASIRNGGKYLDHFDGYLSGLYQSLGFEEYKRDKFEPQYDEDGSFREKYGAADVIYRKYAA
jgi:hypothetical protein